MSTIGSESVELGMEVFVTSAGQINVHGQPYKKALLMCSAHLTFDPRCTQCELTIFSSPMHKSVEHPFLKPNCNLKVLKNLENSCKMHNSSSLPRHDASAIPW